MLLIATIYTSNILQHIPYGLAHSKLTTIMKFDCLV